MDQPTFADLEYQRKKHKTRREVFLEKMDAAIPWQKLEERIRPVYPQAGKGRRPYPLAVMLRAHVVQLCYNLSDPGMEDLLYEAESVRRFVGLSVSEAVPDETTILHFRHLLERHGLGEELFKEINAHLEAQGLRLREGDHSGRHHHRGAVFHQEPDWGKRPGDAPSEEGEPVLLRDEAARWGGRGDGPGAQLPDHPGQRA